MNRNQKGAKDAAEWQPDANQCWFAQTVVAVRRKEVGYHRQARVENAFFRYKSILGDRLRSRTRAAQAVESVLACNVLNRMTELGRPESFAIDR